MTKELIQPPQKVGNEVKKALETVTRKNFQLFTYPGKKEQEIVAEGLEVAVVEGAALPIYLVYPPSTDMKLTLSKDLTTQEQIYINTGDATAIVNFGVLARENLMVVDSRRGIGNYFISIYRYEGSLDGKGPLVQGKVACIRAVEEPVVDEAKVDWVPQGVVAFLGMVGFLQDNPTPFLGYVVTTLQKAL